VKSKEAYSVNLIKETRMSKHIDGLVCLHLDTFNDKRGEIWTVYSDEFCDNQFVQDKLTISKFSVLRGFHGDPYTTKLICCLEGEFQLSVVDLRGNSKTYGNSEIYNMSSDRPSIVIVPAGCANAHLCLSKKCIFYYKWSKKYDGPDKQITVAWDDPDIGVDWAIKSPILSERDKHGVSLKEARL
tara:strand:- start:213 stop:767 length:555 start_codon:yes stop_codon:yes gene_type:complete